MQNEKKINRVIDDRNNDRRNADRLWWKFHR